MQNNRKVIPSKYDVYSIVTDIQYLEVAFCSVTKLELSIGNRQITIAKPSYDTKEFVLNQLLIKLSYAKTNCEEDITRINNLIGEGYKS